MFPISEVIESTDSILPPTAEKHVDLDFIISKKRNMLSAQALADTEVYLSVVGESAKNSLLYHDVSLVLQSKGYTVKGNKSRMIEGAPSSKVSMCSSSKPDLLAFHPSKSTILVIDVVQDIP